MKSKKILLTSALTGALLLAACGNEEDVESSEETEVETETETEDVAESTDGNDEDVDEEEVEETPDYIGNMVTDIAQEVKVIKEVDEQPVVQYGEAEFKVTRAQIQELNLSSTEENIKHQLVVEYDIVHNYDEGVIIPIQDGKATLNNGDTLKPTPFAITLSTDDERIHTTIFEINREDIDNMISLDPSEITSFSLDFPNIITSYETDKTGEPIIMYQSETELGSGDFEQYEVQF